MDKRAVEIRSANAEDLANVEMCARDAYAVYVSRMGRKPAPMIANFALKIELEHVYVAENQGAFVGYVVFYCEGDHIHLENVAVSPNQAGKGFGKQLIKYAEKAARDNGLNAVELYTNEAMTENLAMYPSLGYLEIERKEQDGYKRVFFRKLV